LAADGQWRFPRGRKVPEKYFQAVLQFEDRRFYLHPGVDPLAIVRAARQNLSAGRIKSGGSTITMRLARLTGGSGRRTVSRKIRETLLALKIELRYSKREILEHFAASAPFGSNLVGIDAASWFYFGRNPEDLSWSEACFLAVLPKSPSLVASPDGMENIRKKRDLLLERLHRRGFIDELQLKLALKERLPSGFRPLPGEAEHLLQTLANDGKAKTPFRSYVDYELQRRVTARAEIYGEKLLNQGIRNLAAVVIDNRLGAVVAYVGNIGAGRNFDSGQFVDVVQSPRSTGSILKPFLYAAMLQEGFITPEMLIPDIPTRYQGFRPKNFDRQFRGAVRARQALAWSLNVTAVRMLYQYGIPRFKNLLASWGMSTLFRPADDYGLSLILGGAEGKLLEIASIYAGIGRRAMGLKGAGEKVRLLQDEKPRTTGLSRLSPGAAYLTLEALTEVNRPDEEGFWRNFSSSRWVAWKTGTSFGLKDAWAVGVTPNYTVGVWAGNADGEGRPEITGVAAAAPFMFEVIALLDTGGEIRPPYRELKRVEICADSGCLPGDLCTKKIIWLPRESHFDRGCAFHQLIHLDPSGKYRVDSRVESVANMRPRVWFVLPPVQEYYYRAHHPEYRPLPPFKGERVQEVEVAEGTRVMNLIYPEPGTTVYIPVDLNGQPGEVVLEAVHRQPGAVIHWHLDEKYLAITRYFHQVTCNPPPGEHVLVLVDNEGRRLVRPFTVISRGEAGSRMAAGEHR
ncbi:MAG: penicillin-binding protein 1C, partial [Candidatus Saccharicenans sp.]|nr:penicillin-binding protein 1C [Candidatus Saccharicenans sp.]